MEDFIFLCSNEGNNRNLQCQINYVEQSKEIEQNFTAPKNFKNVLYISKRNIALGSYLTHF